MKYPEHLITVDDFSEFSFKEKGSTFTGQVFHSESEKETDEILSIVKKKHYDATHHCYAYKLLNGKFKYSDDGEPNGTAGIRIYNAIEHFNLINILVIVIRYYGGTNLGVGPLGKAYYKSAYEVLSESTKVKKLLYELILIESGFEHIGHIHRAISNHKATIAKTEYRDQAIFECWVIPSEMESFKKQLKEFSNGKIKINLVMKKYYN